MDDKTADKYVETFFDAIEQSQGVDSKKRMLRLLVKEVERDTRHKAYDLVQRLGHDIENLNHSSS